MFFQPPPPPPAATCRLQLRVSVCFAHHSSMSTEAYLQGRDEFGARTLKTHSVNVPICCFNKHLYVSWLKHTRTLVEEKNSSFISIFKIMHLLLCTFSIEVGDYTYLCLLPGAAAYCIYNYACLLPYFFVIFCTFYHYSVFTIFMLCVQRDETGSFIVPVYNDKKELISGYVWPLINSVFSNLATLWWRELLKDGLKQTCSAEQRQPSE